MKFQVGKPVTGENLIGRGKELKAIETYLDMGQSVVLIAPRRFGKTSLMLEILRRYEQRGDFTLYTDLFSTPDVFNLAAEITQGVLRNRKLSITVHQLKNQVADLMKNLQFRQEIEGQEFILGFGQSGMNEWDLLRSSIRLIESFSEKYQKTMIGVFDEFGDISKLDGDKIIKLFRSEIQLQKQSVFLFSGSYESIMSEIFMTPAAPFYRFARIIHLDCIKYDDFQNYLTPIFETEHFEQAAKLAGQITRFTGGHPYYTPLMAQQAVFHKDHFKQAKTSLRDLIEITLEAEAGYLEKVWDEISAKHQEKTIILTLASGETALYQALDHRKVNISRTLKRLVATGLLRKSTDAYTLTDPLLHYWIRDKILKLPTGKRVKG